MSKSEHFSAKTGKCLDYHIHIVLKRGDSSVSVGWEATFIDKRVYIEPHGEVMARSKLPNIGKRAARELKEEVAKELGRFPQEYRRLPSKKAICLGAI